eukprot:TRINITY_DN10819_c0_g1_i1.p1 TRINITY_DN10819_c0_g1~~TRINITY_DN10819_c0_g1_i1.p1  ORF type:complete len:783 (+),score=181.93 TRINITY_DN10819_c0_g1_i1:63-2411(+)
MTSRRERRLLQELISQYGTLGEPDAQDILNETSSYFDTGDSSESRPDENLSFYANSDIETPKKKDPSQKKQHKEIDRLRSELLSRDVEISKIRADSQNEIFELQERSKDLKHQLEMSRLENQRLEELCRQIERSAESDLNRLKQSIAVLEAQPNYMMGRLKDSRNSLAELIPSETLYVELRRLAPDSLSLEQFVQLKAYELNQNYKADHEVLRRDIGDLRLALAEKDEQLLVQKREKDRILRVTSDEIDELKLNLTILDVKLKKAEKDLEEKRTHIEQLSAKGSLYDELRLYANDLEKKVASLTAERDSLDVQLHDAVSARDEIKQKCEELRQESDLLRMDKAYLERESKSSRSMYDKADDQCRILAAKVAELQKSRDEMYDKLISNREDQKNMYEEKLRVELEKIKQHNEDSLQKITHDYKDVTERELRSLRDERNIAVSECKAATLQSEEAKRAYQEILEEFRAYRHASDEKAKDLENELRIRSHDADRLALGFEETRELLRRSNAETDLYRKKMEVLTAEYYKLQSESSKRIAELETGLTSNCAKLSMYEMLERKLDEALVHAGAEAEENRPHGDVIDTLGSTIPTTAKRRMMQNIRLAQKLGEFQKENDTLNRKLSELQSNYECVCSELHRANELVQKTQQPYNYLVEAIQTRENELKTAKVVIAQLEKALKLKSHEFQALYEKKQDLERDIERLVNQRGIVTSLAQRTSQKEEGANHGMTTNYRMAPTRSTSSSASSMHAPLQDSSSQKQLPLWYQKLRTNTINTASASDGANAPFY